MGKRSVKRTAMALLCAGCVFQLGGCFGGIFNAMVRTAIPYVALEFVTDNDGIFDLFADGN